MNINEIPTPETDATEKTTDWITGDPVVTSDKMRDLERRLTVARESLKNVCETSSSTRIVKLTHETLNLTAPKQ